MMGNWDKINLACLLFLVCALTGCDKVANGGLTGNFPKPDINAWEWQKLEVAYGVKREKGNPGGHLTWRKHWSTTDPDTLKQLKQAFVPEDVRTLTVIFAGMYPLTLTLANGEKWRMSFKDDWSACMYNVRDPGYSYSVRGITTFHQKLISIFTAKQNGKEIHLYTRSPVPAKRQ